MGATGLEHPANPAGNTPVSESGGSKSGNFGADVGPTTLPAASPEPADPELAAVLEAWPSLPAALRSGILAIVAAAGPLPTGGRS